MLGIFHRKKAKTVYSPPEPAPPAPPALRVETDIITVLMGHPHYFCASWNRQDLTGRLINGDREYPLPHDVGIAVDVRYSLTVVLTDAGGEEVYRKAQEYDPDTGRLKNASN